MERSEIGMWAAFLLVMGVVGWYMLEIIRCPYWSKEPVLHTYDLVRRCGLMNSTWKRGMTSYKYNVGVGVGVGVGGGLGGGSGISLWKVGDSGYQGAVEKYTEFLKKEWILGVEGDSYTRSFKLSAGDLEKGAGSGAVISSFALAKYPWWDASFSGGLDTSGGEMGGRGWMMTYPVYYWISEPGISCGGVLGDIWGNGGYGNEKEGETWKVDYLCVSRGVAGGVGGSGIVKKDGVEIVRTLFTTHLYYLIFGLGSGSGIRRNSALFRGDPMSESMRKVVPLVRFGVVEVELDEKKIWPLSKRNWSRGRKWVKVDAKNMTIMQFRLWKKWMEGWYSSGGGSGGNGGALGGFQMVGVFPWSMMMDKVATEDWIVWVLFSSALGEGEMEEIESVLFFRNERCLLEHKDEIRGMTGSGTEIFSLVGSWFARGVSVLEGKECFIRGLREMRRIRKTFRVLRIEGLGYNLGLIAELNVSGGVLEVGKIVNREVCAYYFYNRFWGELEARKCFILL